MIELKPNSMNNFFDNQRILGLIWKRKFHFIIVGVIAIVLSAIFSGPFFIQPKYKSEARIYPSNIGEMSDESNTEQMLEILNSNDIKFQMFEAFNLDEVYGISKDDPQFKTNIFGIYGTNVSIQKTEFETARIKVLDTDPNRASDMCDSLITFYNRKVRGMHRIKHKELVDIYGKQLDEKYQELNGYKSKLDSIREISGIISYSLQAPEATRGYMNSLIDGTGKKSSTDSKKLENIYYNLARYGTEENFYEAKFEATLEYILDIKQLHDEQVAEYEKVITFSHVVEHPFPADKKSYPVRWLIVAFSALSAVFIALITFLILDYGKE